MGPPGCSQLLDGQRADLVSSLLPLSARGGNGQLTLVGLIGAAPRARCGVDPDFSTWLAKRTPAGRWGAVEELVGAAVFLSSDAASFVNGHILYVDGGITASL